MLFVYNFLYYSNLDHLFVSIFSKLKKHTNQHFLQDKYQRALADRENVRLRLEKQVSDAKLYGIQGFCKDLLEVRSFLRLYY